MICCVISKL